MSPEWPLEGNVGEEASAEAALELVLKGATGGDGGAAPELGLEGVAGAGGGAAHELGLEGGAGGVGATGAGARRRGRVSAGDGERATCSCAKGKQHSSK